MTLVRIAYVVGIFVVAAQVASATTESSSHANDVEATNADSKNSGDSPDIDRQLFKKLFKKRRKEHVHAVRDLQKIDKYERQYKLIEVMAEKIFDIIESKKSLFDDLTEAQLMNISVVPSPETTNDLRDALSNVLENIALFGDTVLNLPDITHRILKKHPEWQSTIRWSFEFLNRAKDYLDDTTLRMINLASQELNITERDPNYSNPNTIANMKKAREEKTKESSTRRRKKLKRGPQLTKTEL